MSRVYISGKITGTTDYMERFAKAEKKLTNEGFEVINPAKVTAQLPTTLKWDDYMKVAIPCLEICDTIYMLHGWEDSEGAKKELCYAAENGKHIMFEDGNSNNNLPTRINLNDTVRFKLTDYGKSIYYHQNDAINETYKAVKIPQTMPEVDENGYTKMTLWSFMNLYGGYLRLGNNNVISPLELEIVK